MKPSRAVRLLACASVLGAASCGPKEPPPVTVGLNLELSGDIQIIGQSAQRTAEFFFEKLNEAGGLEMAGGRQRVKLISNDNAANATQAASVAQQLISRDNVIAMIGPNSGNCAAAAADIAEGLKCVMISPWSSDPNTTMDRVAGVPKRYVFRAGATDELQGRVMAKFAADKLGARRAAIIASDARDAAAQAAAFKDAFAAAGGEVVAEESFDVTDRDFPRRVAAVAAASPEAVFLAATCEDAVPILESAKAAGLKAKFLGTELWNSPQTIRMTGLGIDGLFFCKNFDFRAKDAATEKFVADYTAKFGQPPDDVAALTYDSCAILAKALEKSGTTDREALRENLARLSGYEGATGNFEFKPGSGDPVKSLPVIEIKSSGLEWIGDIAP